MGPANALSRPRLGILGPMLGGHPGWVAGQGEILSALLAREGYPVRTASRRLNRWLRLADLATAPARWRGRIDLLVLMVFSDRAFRWAEAASAVARAAGVPLVLWLHGGNLVDFAGRHPGRVERVLARGAARVAPTAFLADAFRDVRRIPNVLEIEGYPFRHRAAVAPRLLWMRTFHEIYRPDLALRTLARLLPDHPDATLTLAGQDRGLLDATRRLAGELGLAGSVRFAGFLDAEGKRREFAEHDVFLNTNRIDNAPVSVVEAAAFGLPVVATRVGGVPHLLRDPRGQETALLVPEGDADAMAAAVRRLLAEPDLAARLSRAGRELAESCSWARVKPLWEDLFREVLA